MSRHLRIHFLSPFGKGLGLFSGAGSISGMGRLTPQRMSYTRTSERLRYALSAAFLSPSGSNLSAMLPYPQPD